MSDQEPISTPDEETDQSTADQEGVTEAPALNRAERRAQAKGKKAGPNPTMPQAGKGFGGGMQNSNASRNRFHRTGHK